MPHGGKDQGNLVTVVAHLGRFLSDLRQQDDVSLPDGFGDIVYLGIGIVQEFLPFEVMGIFHPQEYLMAFLSPFCSPWGM